MRAAEEQIRILFLEALDRPAEQWAGFLEQACGDQIAVRHRVEALLHAHRKLGDAPQAPTPRAVALPWSHGKVGRYRLLEQIGEGSFGIVFLAEQEEPVRRAVAIKILKPGVRTGQVLARFRVEQQALAMMDHRFVQVAH